jgi:hypothetical protein
VDFDIKRGRILTQVAGNQEEDFFVQRSTGAELRPPAVRRSWLAPLRVPFGARKPCFRASCLYFCPLQAGLHAVAASVAAGPALTAVVVAAPLPVRVEHLVVGRSQAAALPASKASALVWYS